LFIVLLLQLSLGISNIIWALPLGIAVAHNAVGALLLLTFVGLCHRIYTVRLISD
jgi:cytochrome c oxidase assembly protein subunit 15